MQGIEDLFFSGVLDDVAIIVFVLVVAWLAWAMRYNRE